MMRRDDARHLAVLGSAFAGCLALGSASGDAALAAIGGAWLIGLASTARPWLAPYLERIDHRYLGGGLVAAASAVGAVQGGLTLAIAQGLMAWILATRLSAPRPATDRAALLAAALLVVLGAATSASWLVGLGVTIQALCTPVAALLATLPYASGRRVAWRHLGLVSAAVVVGEIVLFLLLPRFLHGTSPAAPDATEATIGFAPDVALGDVDRLRDDPTITLVLRAAPGTLPPMHVRGRILDTWDGKNWRATVPPSTAPIRGIPWEIVATEHAGSLAFAPGPISEVPTGFVPSPGAFRLAGPPRAFRAQLTVTDLEAVVDLDDTGPWLQLPREVQQGELGELAGAEGEARKRASAVVAALSRFTYTHEPQEAGVDAPIDEFLRRKTGHCEHFATTAALALRVVGVPARVVTGYAAPAGLGDGVWYFRRSNAHAWVEYRDEEGRWWTLDPTPGGAPAATDPGRAEIGISERLDLWWRDTILGYDQEKQTQIVSSTASWAQARLTGLDPGESTPWLGMAAVLLAFALGAAGIARVGYGVARSLAGERPARPEGRVARAHASARAAVERAGYPVPPSLPPVEAARWLRRQAPEAGEALERLAWLHYRVRYAAEPDAALVNEARQAAREVQRTLARASGGGRAPDDVSG